MREGEERGKMEGKDERRKKKGEGEQGWGESGR